MDIGFIDVNEHRQVVKTFALREFPTLLLFPRSLGRQQPISILYHPSRTASSYFREMKRYSTMVADISSLPVGIAEKLQQILKSTPLLPNVTASTSVGAQGEPQLVEKAVLAEPLEAVVEDASEPLPALPGARYANATHSIAELIQEEREHQAHLSAIVDQRLAFVPSILETAAKRGTAGLARELNDKMQELLLGGELLKQSVRQRLLIEVTMLQGAVAAAGLVR